MIEIDISISARPTNRSTVYHIKQRLVVDASHQELLTITAELSKPIKDQDSQIKHLVQAKTNVTPHEVIYQNLKKKKIAMASGCIFGMHDCMSSQSPFIQS